MKSLNHDSVHYTALAFVEVLEEPLMNWKDLLAKVGCSLHLLLGVSLLTFVEVAEMLSLVCFRVSAQREFKTKSRMFSSELTSYLTFIK